MIYFFHDIIENLEKGISDSQLFFILAGMKVIQQKEEKAIEYYKKCLALNAASAASHAALAMLYLEKEDLVNAEKHVYKVLEINPKMNNAHFNLAQLLEKRGDTSLAKEAYRKELDNSPNHFKATFNLSRLFRKTNQVLEEETYLNRTIEINPDFPMAYFYLARIYLNRGEKYSEAISLVEEGIGKKPEDKDLALGYFLLADLFNRIGNNAKSLEYAQKGQELAQKIQ